MRNRLFNPHQRLVVGLPRSGIFCLRSSVSMSRVLGTGSLTRAGGPQALLIDASSLRQGRRLMTVLNGQACEAFPEGDLS
jgi:hypothetical protein